MCVTCGCGQGETRIEGIAVGDGDPRHAHLHTHADGTVHAHAHADADHEHERRDAHAHAHDHAHVHADAHAHDHALAKGKDHAHRQGHAHDGMHVHIHAHAHEGGHWHQHADGGWHDHGPATSTAAPLGAAHAAGIDATRRVQIERDILAKNDAVAAANRRLLAERGIFAINLVSSPGSGKTTLLVKTIEALRGRLVASVIEGDQQTSRDADRIRATGAPAIQVNTGKGCHLDAEMVGRALARLDPPEGSLLLVENVGNLVCPAAFDLGEAHKVVILSVTEGDDKPIKYPDMFHAADLLLLNKVDLLPYVEFDVDAAIAFARRVQPGIGVMQVSATTGAGFDAWLAWLERGVAAARLRRGTGASPQAALA